MFPEWLWPVWIPSTHPLPGLHSKNVAFDKEIAPRRQGSQSIRVLRENCQGRNEI